MSELEPYRMLIDGQRVASNAVIDVINPADERVFARAAAADADWLDKAVRAARAAWPDWRDTPAAERRSVLLAMADQIERHADELQALITGEQGKPLRDAAVETETALAVLRYYAEFDLAPEVLRDDAQQRAELHRKPLGVVAAIVPWNFPFLMACYKIAPALMAGNTVVVKPAPSTPVATLRLGALLADIVPPGVLNVLGDAGDLGPYVSAHPDVDKISFTGSTRTGRAVMASAADTLKRLTLELGGNDAAIVLDDVDIEAVAPQLFALAFVNSGQVCMAIKRIYIQAGIYEPLCAALVECAQRARVGDGMDPASDYGPLQNRSQFERVKQTLAQAPRYGRVIAGGRSWGPGYFVAPTLVADIEEGNPIVDEEVFGPVRTLLRFDTVDEAVARANRSPYGLGASVWSRDSGRATDIARRLEAGSVWVNQHFAMAPDIPFGGVKQSGIGREFGRLGLYEHTECQSVVIAKS